MLRFRGNSSGVLRLLTLLSLKALGEGSCSSFEVLLRVFESKELRRLSSLNSGFLGVSGDGVKSRRAVGLVSIESLSVHSVK
jgi:hypothetical protein